MTPERFARLRAALARRQPDLTVLMDRVNKSHNFSAILRNCDATGVLRAHVVPPDGGLDLHHGTSAGTKKWVEVRHHPDVTTAVEHLHREGFQVLAAHPSDTSVDFREVDYTRPTAVMMGAELHGVSAEGLALADLHVVIPMMGMVHSLNVSVATSLILYEAMRQRDAAGMYAQNRIPPDDFERRLFEWAYPSIAARRRAEGRSYPALTPEGELVRDW
ncbi:MAG: tRNA (guanine-N2)-dimethyltransferase [Gemmatimonas sp. SG8_23]|jgi:tRNA (guanosine-2'-O-)-methyltransferase|nr:MAG: tRNA (guanine-N2)-dimethyltransferase [Gemmatimonas sp. SG8_23]